MINFKESKLDEFKNFLGGEGSLNAKMVVDDLNRIIKGRLEPNCSIGMHTHGTSSEIIFIAEGNAKFILDGKEERVEAGNCHYCPKGHSHTFINDTNEPIVFFAVVPQQ